jgi:hypothetical protein
MRNPISGHPEISRREADLLLDRASSNPAHRGLADLLSAAAGPPMPHETKGERAAVRRFRQSYRASLRPRRRPARIGAVVTAAAAAVLLGSTAYAASSGHLPEPLQRTAHDWFSGVGVPAPPSPSVSPSRSRAASPSPSPSSSPSLLRELCVAWQAFENDPHAPQLTAEEHHTLGEAAGSNGKKQIDAFCAGLLSPSESPSAPPPPTAGGPPNGPPGGPPGQNKPSKPGPKKSHK